MITVAGETLMDVVVGAGGSLTAFPGGAPFNVARAVARLGADCQFVGAISDDLFGDQLRTALEAVGVGVPLTEATSAPTALSVAQVDASGSADYRFYLEGTAVANLAPGDLPPDLLATTEAIAFGGLAILVEPAASTLLGLVSDAPEEATVLLDPNCRPQALRGPRTYWTVVAPHLARADIVKVSVDDLRVLDPSADPASTARMLLSLGPSAVVMTDGPEPVTVFAAGGETSVPSPRVEIVDTIGAGDALVAGFLTGWTARSLRRGDCGNLDVLVPVVAAATVVAAAACTVAGAGLPADFSWSPT